MTKYIVGCGIGSWNRKRTVRENCRNPNKAYIYYCMLIPWVLTRLEHGLYMMFTLGEAK